MTTNEKGTDGESKFTSPQVFTQALQILVWPIIVLSIVLLFNKPIFDLVEKSDVSVSAGNFAIDLKRTKDFVQKASKDDDISGIEIGSIAGISLDEQTKTELSRAKILWVDDDPYNNKYVILALDALGVRITNALSTKEAEFYLSNTNFDIVITDMCRAQISVCRQVKTDELDGYVLLDSMQRMKPFALLPPVLIYASYDGGSQAAYSKIRKESRDRGAYGQTNRPIELIELVIQIVSKAANN